MFVLNIIVLSSIVFVVTTGLLLLFMENYKPPKLKSGIMLSYNNDVFTLCKA